MRLVTLPGLVSRLLLQVPLLVMAPFSGWAFVTGCIAVTWGDLGLLVRAVPITILGSELTTR